MKNIILFLIIAPSFVFGQEIATTEDGRKVFLKADGTYEFVKGSIGDGETNQRGEVRGVVTYFFNDNFGNKPDIGAKVMIRRTNEEDSTRHAISRYYRAKSGLYLREGNKKLGKKDKWVEDQLKELGVDNQEDFDKISEIAANHLLVTKYDKETIQLTVDASGNFKKDLNPGKYEIIVISKNRSDATLAEAMGKIDSKVIEIKAGESNDVAFEFTLH